MLLLPSCASRHPAAGPVTTQAVARPGADLVQEARWRFQRSDDGLPRSGQWRDGFAVVDLDGDGHADVVHGPPRKEPGPPVVFRGDGAGHWSRWDAPHYPQAYDYGDVAVGDLTGHGRLDLAVAAHLRGLFALTRTAPDAFADASRGLEAPVGGARVTARALALVDWNHDGRLDLVAPGEGPGSGSEGTALAAGSNGLYVFLNQGDGSWALLPRPAGPPGPPSAAVVVGDVDGDGWPDAVTGTDELGRKDILYLGGARRMERRTLAALPDQELVHGVALIDVDGNGKNDVVVAGVARDARGWYGRLDVVRDPLSRKSGIRTLAVLDGRAGFVAVAVGDVDGDGVPDVVAAAGDGTVLPFRGDGHGGVRRERTLASPFPGCTARHVVLADADGRRGDEIFVSYGDEAGTCRGGGGIAAWTLQ